MKKVLQFFFVFSLVWLLLLIPINIASNYSKNKEQEVSNIYDENERIDIRDLKIEEISYTIFMDKVHSFDVTTIYYSSNKSIFYMVDNDETFFVVQNPEYEGFKKEMLERDIQVKSLDILITQDENSNGISFGGILLIGSIIVFVVLLIKANKQNNSEITFIDNKSMATFNNNGDIDKGKGVSNKDLAIKKFSDVAGLVEVKKDMECLVDFLKNREKYEQAGAKLPKGVILYGPPGTGKTLLAKAVAGEAGLPFLYKSASSFVELYVGVGAKNIRELFNKARKNAPCVVFIDEIDAIGRKRSGRDTNGEDRKTLNELLIAMDGFKESDNILVIAATNSDLDELDEALLRPGRFTNKFCVPLPETAKERLEILNLYSKNKHFDETVDLERLSKETIGFSPSALEALLNEAAIISVQEKKYAISNEIMEKAMYKILLSGHMKENQMDRSKEELELVAWHEAGHALLGKLHNKEVNKVTIISSTSGAGGVTFTTPNKTHLLSVEDLENEVIELYGGRIAEYLLLNDKNKITTGASNDIEKATNIIRKIVSIYGMNNEIGMLNLTHISTNEDVELKEEIKIAKELEEKTISLLRENYEKLKCIATNLLEKETLYDKDLNEIMEM